MDYAPEQLEHALRYLKFIKREDDSIALDVSVDDQFGEYLDDLIGYGITRYIAENGERTGFGLWQNYRMDQVQLKLLKNPGYTAVGTY